MYRVLIIDNEPVIVNGIYNLFLDLDHVELGVLKAYSASEALGLLAKHTVDIVFADIQMPGMNGLELQQAIMKSWPRCKVVFLTGYTEFSYVQTAMRNGGFDYVLKTEGDERILEALDSAIASIQAFNEKDRLIEDAKRELHKAKPILQKEFLHGMLDGNSAWSKDMLQHKLEELGLTLLADPPLLLAIGRIDEWSASYSVSDRLLLLFAIHNIAQDYLTHCSIHYVSYDRNKFVWFIQKPGLEAKAGDTFSQTVQESLESIQSACKQMLKTTVSFVTHRNPCPWEDVPSIFRDLKRLLGRGLGLGNEILLTDTITASEAVQTEVYRDPSTGNSRTKLLLLESYLESGSFKEFSSLCHAMLGTATSSSRYSFVEIYYAIATMILTYMNQMEMTSELMQLPEIDGLMRIEEHESWESAAQFFEDVARVLAERIRKEQKENSNIIVDMLHQYIQERMEDDLSLTRLAEVVSLNPSYLSRLYKQMTGHGLAEYIAEKRIEKATLLLAKSSLKIHEIARQVGLEQGYFIKMFKKYVQMTPHEYREALS